MLAAQTDSPTVVEIFSQALKNVSEGRLRAFFDATAQPFAEDVELVRAGVQGAAHMAALTPAQMECACAQGEALAAGGAPPEPAPNDDCMTAQQRVRWQTAWRMVTPPAENQTPKS